MERPDKEGKIMLLTVFSTLQKPENKFATLRPGITVPMGLLENQIHLIIDTEAKADSPIFGDTIDKANKYDLMCHSVFVVASAASSYYSVPATADPAQKAKVSFSLPAIINVGYAKAEAFTKGIIDIVTPLIDNLEPYGVKQINLDDAISKRQDFLDVQTKPRTNIDERKVQNANIHPYVNEGKRILEEICDPVVNTLFIENHDLFALYYNAREIINFPHGTTVVEGYVYKSDGKTPIYNATVNFPEQHLITKTLLDGSYRMIKFPIGVTTPVASYETVQQISEPFEVKQGQTVKHNFILPI